jgi:hypothetical protein
VPCTSFWLHIEFHDGACTLRGILFRGCFGRASIRAAPPLSVVGCLGCEPASGKVAGTSSAGAPASRGFVALSALGGTLAFALHGAEVGVVSTPVGLTLGGGDGALQRGRVVQGHHEEWGKIDEAACR